MGRPKGIPVVTCIILHYALEFFELILGCPPAARTLLSTCAEGSEGHRLMNWFVLASVTGN